VTISGDLITHVRVLHKMAQDVIAHGGTTDLTPFAIPAYILAVTAVEAFVNEIFLSDFGSLVLGESRLLPDEAEKLDVRLKLILFPQFAFGQTLPKAEQPYQDMDLLVKLRNELVHYKMNTKPPTLIKQLAQRKIAMGVPAEEESGGPLSWTDRVSTLEGIRWANNTACETVLALLALAPPEKQPSLARLGHNFQQIP
jgi:hypothetical protein